MKMSMGSIHTLGQIGELNVLTFRYMNSTVQYMYMYVQSYCRLPVHGQHVQSCTIYMYMYCVCAIDRDSALVYMYVFMCMVLFIGCSFSSTFLGCSILVQVFPQVLLIPVCKNFFSRWETMSWSEAASKLSHLRMIMANLFDGWV